MMLCHRIHRKRYLQSDRIPGYGVNLGDLPDLMPDLLAVDEDVVDH